MSFGHLTGAYTYRSFLDRPTANPPEILWAEGELFHRVQPDEAIAGQQRFPANLVAQPKAILDLTCQAVDDCVDFWFAAHEGIHPGEVKARRARGLDWFARGPSVRKADSFDWRRAGGGGDHGSHGAHGSGTNELTTLCEVMTILRETRAPQSALAVPRATEASSFAAVILVLQRNGM